MQIASYYADDTFGARIAAVEDQQARLAARGALTGPGAAAATEQLRQEFIYHSARMQGNRLARVEVARALTREPVLGQLPDAQQEVRNLFLGLDYIDMLAAGDMPLTERLIRILHAVVMRGLSANGEESGAYRSVDLTDLGYPVPPALDVIPEMGSFARWLTLRADSPEYVPSPVLRATYAHTRLLNIHPFVEGNGRTARLLLNLVLQRAGFPVVALDSAQYRAYLRGLEVVSARGDLTLILQMVLTALEHSLAAYGAA